MGAHEVISRLPEENPALCPLRELGRGQSPVTTRTWALSSGKKLIVRPFGIMGLGENSCQIFEFKGLIGKIFRNKDLEASFSRFQSPNLAQVKRGTGIIPHPFASSSIISTSTGASDNFSRFISPAYSSR
jgi:hypothetical protein